ncbi:hypothetical protein T4E_12021 [Trichinella pseudospiralis]|uniref:Uncharacterized protein n=1 Tax=Trichinella pseudospiralis TaxID=6337 RepID=A0A0V0Y8B0_TRIPS|nr:hypothetical protein T4E_12021 [Trichinella pseudospiralis]
MRKISDKDLCKTFMKLIKQCRILSNWRKQALNDKRGCGDLEINSTDWISKFIFNPGVHRPPFDPSKPLSTPQIVPSTLRGSILTTLATSDLDPSWASFNQWTSLQAFIERDIRVLKHMDQVNTNHHDIA